MVYLHQLILIELYTPVKLLVKQQAVPLWHICDLRMGKSSLWEGLECGDNGPIIALKSHQRTAGEQ